MASQQGREHIAAGWLPGFAHQQAQGRALEQDAQLGLSGRRGDVGEHALLLHDDLEHIWHLEAQTFAASVAVTALYMLGLSAVPSAGLLTHHAAGVPQGVLLADPVADQLLILQVQPEYFSAL